MQVFELEKQRLEALRNLRERLWASGDSPFIDQASSLLLTASDVHESDVHEHQLYQVADRLFEKNLQTDLCRKYGYYAITCEKKEWGDNDDVHLRQQGLSWDEVDRLRRSRGLGKGRGPRRQELERLEEQLQAARAIVPGASACVHGNTYGDVSAPLAAPVPLIAPPTTPPGPATSPRCVCVRA